MRTIPQEKPKKRPTILDVAELAGTTRSTAARAFSGTGYVSPEKREAVMNAAKQLGYHPNAVARSFRQQQTNVIGIYSGYGYLSAQSQFLAELLGGMQRGCDAHGKNLFLYGSFANRHIDETYRELSSGRVDGLVLYSPPDDELINRLAESHLPVVAVGDSVPPLPSITVDDAGGSRVLFEYLWEKGHRHFMYYWPPALFASVEKRFWAFKNAVEERGGTVYEGRASQYGVQLTDDEARHLLEQCGDEISAIACWNDTAADQMLDFLQREGIRKAVVGFDGLWSGRRLAYDITTVAAPWNDVGETAIALLMAQIAGKEVAQETVLPVRLITGQTA